MANRVNGTLAVMDKSINIISGAVRRFMIIPARAINSLSGGRIRPNHITLVSLLGHFTVVWALWHHRPLVAALLLAIFGIMDSLDGALARLQKSDSVTGMLYDAVSDRIKEVLVYVGLAGFVSIYTAYINGDYSVHIDGNFAGYWLIVAVCGMSLVVSYIKAKGEVAASGQGAHNAQELNRVFVGGIARYEIRMAFVIVGLLTGQIINVLWFLLVLISFTALQRIVRITKYLQKHHV